MLINKLINKLKPNIFDFCFCLIWDLGQYAMRNRIRTEIMHRSHLLNLDLVDFCSSTFFFTTHVANIAFRVHITSLTNRVLYINQYPLVLVTPFEPNIEFMFFTEQYSLVLETPFEPQTELMFFTTWEGITPARHNAGKA